MLKKIEYTSLSPGKTVLFFGAIHGNETCGPRALNEIIQEIDSGKITIKSGKIIIVPVCNPLAYEQNKRFIDVNLNRVFKKHTNPILYEEKLANVLCDYVDKIDVLLDIHSIHSDGKPFIFQDYADKETESFVKHLWITNILTWWPQMYEQTSDSDTTLYNHKKWAIGTVVECWNHNYINAFAVAKKAIMNTLIYLDIIDGKLETNIYTETIHALYFMKKNKQWKLSQNWNHLDPVKKWEPIAVYDDGEVLVATEDGYILLPFAEASIGAEWYYFWKKLTN